jgi:hypothetical protein
MVRRREIKQPWPTKGHGGCIPQPILAQALKTAKAVHGLYPQPHFIARHSLVYSPQNKAILFLVPQLFTEYPEPVFYRLNRWDLFTPSITTCFQG